MKKVPRSDKPLFGQTPPPGLFDTSDKRRLILMSAALIALLAVFVVSQLQRQGGQAALEQQQRLAIEEVAPTPVEEIVVPAFDLERLRGKVSDSRETDRVLRESAGLEELARHARGFGDPHFLALGVRELDAQALREIESDPAAQRAKPFRARGRVQRFEASQDRDGRERLDGYLVMESGETVFFSVWRAPDSLLVGDFIRLDGFFFKLFRDELGRDEWTEGPYLVGDRAVRSDPVLEPFDPERLARELARVEDDGTTSMTRLGGDAHRAKWELLRFAQLPQAAQIDWEAAPELNGALMARLVREGSEFRGAPIRIPVSRIQAMRTPRAGENPLRLSHLSSGWIGNTNWTGGPGVIQFAMPPREQDLALGAYCTARGFFLKNLAYEDQAGVLRTAPYFVLHSLEPFDVPEDVMIRNVAWFVAGLTVFLVGLFFVLLMRDRKRSEQFQAELVRRRRARRERAANSPGETAS